MTEPRTAALRWLTDPAKPPLWLRVTAAVGFTLAATGMSGRRGPLVTAVAVVVYGGMALAGLFAWDRMVGWSRRHPRVDSLLFVPLAFLALAYVTDLPTGVCLLVALAAGLVFVPLAARTRRRRAARG